MKGSNTRYHGRRASSPLLIVAHALGIRTTKSVAESRRRHRHGDIAHTRSILTGQGRRHVRARERVFRIGSLLSVSGRLTHQALSLVKTNRDRAVLSPSRTQLKKSRC